VNDLLLDHDKMHVTVFDFSMFVAGYSFLAEGTANATWGGSTQGTLDDLAEQDNDIQEQSAGYSRLMNVLKYCW
jgi:hypothetical protein